MKTRLPSLLVFGGLTALAALAGVRSSQVVKGRWFRKLRKPAFQPPDKAFGPVWTVLYGLIAGAGWRLWKQPPSPERSRALAWWAAQLGLNAAWSPLFFERRRPRAALVDITLLLGAIIGLVRSAKRVDPTASKMLVPYLGWVGFATAINEEIVRLNPRAR